MHGPEARGVALLYFFNFCRTEAAGRRAARSISQPTPAVPEADAVQVTLAATQQPAPPATTRCASQRGSLVRQLSSLKQSFVQQRRASLQRGSLIQGSVSEEGCASPSSFDDDRASATSSNAHTRPAKRGSHTPRVGRLGAELGTRSAAATQSSKLSYNPRSWAATARTCFNIRQKGCFVLVPWLTLSLMAALSVVLSQLFAGKLVDGFEIMPDAEDGMVPGNVPVALGSTMSLLLAFRLNIAYKRWCVAPPVGSTFAARTSRPPRSRPPPPPIQHRVLHRRPVPTRQVGGAAALGEHHQRLAVRPRELQPRSFQMETTPSRPDGHLRCSSHPIYPRVGAARS